MVAARRVAAALGAVGALLVASGGARAATVITPTRIVVSGSGSIVAIQRAPFGLAFGTPGRPPALREVPTDGRPSVLPPTVDPVPPGTEPASSGQLYAPLSYLVGTQSIQQYDGLVWGGNLMSGLRSGVQYSAQRVTRVVRAGAGVRLTVSTDELTGRTLRVDVAPAGRGLVEVRVTPHPATGVALMSDAFNSAPGEAFYGFGGRHNALDQRGSNLASFVQEENMSGFPAAQAGTPAATLFPNGPTAAYYPQAEFISSAGYGFLLDQPQLAWFRMDSDRPDAWSVAADAPSLRYVVAPGPPARAIADLTRRTGRQPAPPSWALGPMLDRLVKNVGETAADYQAELAQDVVDVGRYHLPLTAYRIEGWGLPGSGNDGLALHSFTTPAEQATIIRRLRARHIHPLAYLRPWITPGSAPDQAGLTVRRADGSTYTTTTTTGGSIALLDFTNPAARAFWTRAIARTLNLGFDGFMADFGEEVLADMHFHNGQTGATMHNAYLVAYMRATRAAVRAYERAHPRRHIWFFNRAGYSGSPGSAAYEGGNFPGDESTDWSQAAGLASLAPDMLSRAIGGAFGYATDIGGYYDYTTPATTKELFLRWAEWAALSPIFRLHGSGLHGTHTPWSYDMPTVRAYDALSRLHEAASGLIMRLWREADRTGMPPTRPLWLEYPRDRRAAAVEQEWMLGPDVLVAPVVTQGARSVRAYLPRGCWHEPQTHVTVRGPAARVLSAPLTRLTFFFRCGTRPFRVR